MIIIIKTILVQINRYIGRPGKFDKPVNSAIIYQMVVFFRIIGCSGAHVDKMRHAEIKQDKGQDLETPDRSFGHGLVGRLFTNHPRSVGETYGEHMGFAMGVAGSLFLAGAAAFIHALVPALYQTSASKRITRLATNVSPTD